MNVRLIILPPSKIRTKTKKLAIQYAKAGPHFFAVDNKALIPHVTLFRTKVNKRQLPNVYAAIGQALRDHKSIALQLYRLYPHVDGWLVWDIVKNKSLSTLRKHLANVVGEYALEDLVLKKDFRPHITLTKYKNPSIGKQVVKRVKIPKTPWRATTVAVTLYNKHAQVIKILKIFKLH